MEILKSCDYNKIYVNGLDIVMLPPENVTGDVSNVDSATEDLNMKNLPGN